MNRKLHVGNHELEYALLSDVGLVRSMNQDAVAIAAADSERAWHERGHMFVVADGMGAHAAGELASKIAADTVPASYRKRRWRRPPDALLRAVREANARIYARGAANEEFRGMGTTLTALVLTPQGALVAHVGDSRAYRLRGDTLDQLTFDHSLVWEVCEAEGISEEEVPAYIPRNVITRSVGTRPEVEIDMEGPFPLEAGDTFLLCSDGLTAGLADCEVGAVLACFPPGEAVRALVDLALSRGGEDNISAIVVQYRHAGAGNSGEQANPNPAPTQLPALLWGLPPALALVVGAAGWSAGKAAGAAIGAAAGGLAGTWGVARAWRRARIPWDRQLEGRLGRGPYVHRRCPVDRPTAERFRDSVRQLQQVGQAEGWPIDWTRFEALSEKAQSALESGDYAQAIRHYCHSVSFVVEKVRQQPEESTQ